MLRYIHPAEKNGTLCQFKRPKGVNLPAKGTKAGSPLQLFRKNTLLAAQDLNPAFFEFYQTYLFLRFVDIGNFPIHLSPGEEQLPDFPKDSFGPLLHLRQQSQ